MWTTDRYPEEGVGVIVATNTYGLVQTHLRAAAWDGASWVDADGEPVDGVIAWTEIPEYDGGINNEGIQAED